MNKNKATKMILMSITMTAATVCASVLPAVTGNVVAWAEGTAEKENSTLLPDKVSDSSGEAAVSETGNEKSGFMEENGRFYFYNKDGTMAVNTLKTIDGKTYYFGEDGAAVTGKLIKSDVNIYYFGEDGVAVTQKMMELDGKKYYFDEAGMAVTQKMMELDGNKYYFGEDGAAVTKKLVEVDGNKYFFNKNGTAVTKRLINIGGNRYFFGKNGAAVTVKLKKINGSWYFFNKNGIALQKKWKTIHNGRYYFRTKGKAATGVSKVGNQYYYFNSKGIRQTKSGKEGKTYYYLDAKGYLQATKVKKTYFYRNGKKMSYADQMDFTTQLRAQKIVKQITNSGMSKSQKLLKCFRWVQKFPYVTRRKMTFVDYWPALFANDHFIRHGGDCRADAAAFAYLAAAVGYKNVYVCCDSRNPNQEVHSWTEVNGRVYDPLFAQAKGFSKYYNVSYRSYYGTAIVHTKIPRFHYTQTSEQEAGKKTTVTRKITRWDTKTKTLYYNDGTKVTGIVVYKKKFYAFDKKGKYKEKLTENIRKAAKKDRDIKEFIRYAGKPEKKSYSASCLKEGAQDGIWTYKNFKITTLKDTDGSEVFMSVL